MCNAQGRWVDGHSFRCQAMAVSCKRRSPNVPLCALALSPWNGFRPAFSRAALYSGVILPVLVWKNPFPRSVMTYLGAAPSGGGGPSTLQRGAPWGTERGTDAPCIGTQ